MYQELMRLWRINRRFVVTQKWQLLIRCACHFPYALSIYKRVGKEKHTTKPGGDLIQNINTAELESPVHYLLYFIWTFQPVLYMDPLVLLLKWIVIVHSVCITYFVNMQCVRGKSALGTGTGKCFALFFLVLFIWFWGKILHDLNIFDRFCENNFIHLILLTQQIYSQHLYSNPVHVKYKLIHRGAVEVGGFAREQSCRARTWPLFSWHITMVTLGWCPTRLPEERKPTSLPAFIRVKKNRHLRKWLSESKSFTLHLGLS